MKKEIPLIVVMVMCVGIVPVNGQPYWAVENQVTHSPSARSLPPTATAKGVAIYNPKSLHIVYAEVTSSSEAGVYYGFSSDQGRTWQRTLVSPVPPPDPSYWYYWYPAVDVQKTVGGTEKIHIVYLQDTAGNGAGAVWYRNLPNEAVRLTPPDTFAAKAPTVSANDNGVVIAAWLWTAGRPSIRYRRSTDGGLTWGPSSILFEPPGNIGVLLPVSIDFGDNWTLHASWLMYAMGKIRLIYRRSTDAGVTWEAPRELWSADADSPEDEQIGERGPSIAASSNGRICISWVHCWLPSEHNDFSLFTITSGDNGISWETPYELVPKHRALLHPTTACDERSVAYVAWMDSTALGKQIFFSRSLSGNSWSVPAQLTYSSGSSEMPCIGVDELSTLHLMFKDNRTGDEEIYSKWGLQMFTDRFDATGFNQQRNIAMPPWDNARERHIVYWDNGVVYYSYSPNKGATWCLPETVGYGTYPALALGSDSRPRVTYLNNGSIIYAARDYTGKWNYKNVFLGLPPDMWAGPPSMASAGSDFIVYAVHQRLGQVNAPPRRNYIYFSEVTATGVVLPPVILENQTGNICHQPVIACTPAGPSPMVHVVWNTDHQLWYRVRENGEWSEKCRISLPDTSVEPPRYVEPADNPFLECDGSEVYAFWHGPNEDGVFPGEIWQRKRIITRPPHIWIALENQSKSPARESDYPVQITASTTVWMELVATENWDLWVRYQEQPPRSLNATSTPSRFPSCVSGFENEPGRFFWHNYCWTEELRSDLYEVRYGRECEVPIGGRQSPGETQWFEPLKLTVNPAVVRQRVRIGCVLPEEGKLQIGLYDHAGRLIHSIYDGAAGPGRYNLVISCDDLPAGVYFIQAKTAGLMAVRKVVITQ